VISKKLISWHEHYGRKDLPWQQNPTPYRVWISEIMLQQTQVETVKNYFLRFMEKLPTLENLARASLETVLQLWTGLGYYARARHLHRAAVMIMEHYHGEFPDNLDDLIKLPGIGKSTAGAILSFSMQQATTILDGNVKRVLTRIYGLHVWPGDPKVQKQLWEIATKQTPKKNTAIYNQAMMDLGAMICTRSRPDCTNCPLQKNCIANQQQLQPVIPKAKPKKSLPERDGYMVILFNEKSNAILLEKRSAPGIWGGLWCFPECPKFGKPLKHWLPNDVYTIDKLALCTHTFTHYRWHIQPILAQSPSEQIPPSCLQREYVWYNIKTLPPLALAAPVKRFLKNNTIKALL
jgi:A/G-specific adenine glycosylase